MTTLATRSGFSATPGDIRNLNESRRYSQNCLFPPVNPVESQPPGMPITYRFSHRLNDRFVPKTEVSLHLVNVGFGGVIYRGVTELEASYIERGADTQLTQGKEIPSHIYFL